MIEIPGDYLEGGGQILRTAVSLSCILNQPVRVFNIRAKRPKPGLKHQHLHILKTLSRIFKAECKGVELASGEIEFSPQLKVIEEKNLNVDLETAGSIGLFLQSLLLVCSFRSEGIYLEIKGGTCGLGAIPVDYYPIVVFPLLSYSGLNASLEIIKRGYYPKGGGKVKVRVDKIRSPKGINLSKPGRLIQINGLSIASNKLKDRKVGERQAQEARRLLGEKYETAVDIRTEYVDTLSNGSEVNIFASTDTGCILWSDSRGELKKSAEEVGREAANKLSKEIDSGAACDLHLADNLIPWLSLVGGKIKTSEITLHTRTNLWICELFLGRIFNVEGNTISCEGNIDKILS